MSNITIDDANATTLSDRPENVITDETTGDYARVLSKRSSVFGLETIPSVPAYQGFKVESNFNDFNVSQSFTNVISVSGKGLVIGFKFELSDDEVNIRLIVDGNTCFDIDADDLRAITLNNSNNSGLQRIFGTDDFGDFEFFPINPVAYNSSFQIQIRRNVGFGIQIERRYIAYTEEL
jgi:hypothetical protein